MPFEPSHLEGAAPGAPHLAVYTDETGAVLAIPPGARMLLVEDPRRMDSIHPLVLKKVSRRALVFLCGCGRCNREYTFRLDGVKGMHTQTADRTKKALASSKPKG